MERSNNFGTALMEALNRAEGRVCDRSLQAERRRLAHEYVLALIGSKQLDDSAAEEDAEIGLAYADYLIAATTPETEAKS